MLQPGSFLLLLIILLLPLRPAGAEPVQLRITLQLPTTSHLGVNLKRFKDEVEKASNREIAVDIFDNSRLYKDNEALGAVMSGAIDMASLPYQQFHKHAPAIEIFEQPFLMNFEALVRAAANPDSEIRKILDKAVLEATGVRILWWQSYGSSVFFSKSGQHTKHPSGIAGKKVRVFGEAMGNFTKYCGGIPRLISASQQFQAAKDGTVDIVMTGITGVSARDLWKVTDTITRTEHAALEFLVIINEKVWQSLSKDHQRIVAEASSRVERELRDQMADIEAQAYAFARDKGMTVHELSPDEVAEWRACSARLVEDYMMSAGELGARLMSAYGRLRTAPCCSSGPQGAFHLR
jgi:C4-dicarboxylate-binding protein DctP